MAEIFVIFTCIFTIFLLAQSFVPSADKNNVYYIAVDVGGYYTYFVVDQGR